MRPLLFLGLIALAACSSAPRNVPIGEDLLKLPSAGPGPLVGLVPAGATLVLSLPNPAGAAALIHQSSLWSVAEREGWLRELPGVEVVERWTVLQARLGELARLVVPDLHGLLDIPAVVAYAPIGGGGPSGSGWLYIGRIDRNAPPALALARALNLVRASGREVEIERTLGLPVREVAVDSTGEETRRVAYALLADRLIAATDGRLVSAAIELALRTVHSSAAGQAIFADLEARARVAGAAVAFAPAAPPWTSAGILSAELDGLDLSVQLDPRLWAAGDASPDVDEDALLSARAPGLDVGALVKRARVGAAQRVAPVLSALDGAGFGRGLFGQVVDLGAGGSAVILDVARAGTSGESLRALADSLLEEPLTPVALKGGGAGWCSAEDAVCLVGCPGSTRLGWPGAAVLQRACPSFAHDAPVQAAFAMGLEAVVLSTEIREGRGHVQITEHR